jgi:hypothetical protein
MPWWFGHNFALLDGLMLSLSYTTIVVIGLSMYFGRKNHAAFQQHFWLTHAARPVKHQLPSITYSLRILGVITTRKQSELATANALPALLLARHQHDIFARGK